MAGVFDAQPTLHGDIQPIAHDALIGFEGFDEARLTGSVIADENGERSQLDRFAIDDGFEVADADALQPHRINPL